jgi:hypothetical protein
MFFLTFVDAQISSRHPHTNRPIASFSRKHTNPNSKVFFTIKKTLFHTSTKPTVPDSVSCLRVSFFNHPYLFLQHTNPDPHISVSPLQMSNPPSLFLPTNSSVLFFKQRTQIVPLFSLYPIQQTQIVRQHKDGGEAATTRW